MASLVVPPRVRVVAIGNLFLRGVDEALKTGNQDPELLDGVPDFLLVAMGRKPGLEQVADLETGPDATAATAVALIAFGQALQTGDVELATNSSPSHPAASAPLEAIGGRLAVCTDFRKYALE